jgi:hypothetical protein
MLKKELRVLVLEWRCNGDERCVVLDPCGCGLITISSWQLLTTVRAHTPCYQLPYHFTAENSWKRRVGCLPRLARSEDGVTKMRFL